MTLRLDDDQTAMLRATAEAEGLSMQAVAVLAIEEYVSRRRAVRDELIRTIIADNADVLKRLGE